MLSSAHRLRNYDAATVRDSDHEKEYPYATPLDGDS